jgi:ATP-dependent Clp protease ATP-binding subunit ClpC
MFDLFTDRAVRVAVAAQLEARALGHGRVGTAHLLLALTMERPSVATLTLERLGVEPRTVRQLVEEIVAGPQSTGRFSLFTSRAKRVFELSLREALRAGHDRIDTGDLLLGLAREGEGVTPQILRMFGIDLAGLRACVAACRHDRRLCTQSVDASSRP